MDSSTKINWEDEKTYVLLNSKLPVEELEQLNELANLFPQKAHVWVASSGSSKSAQSSVKFIALSKKAFLASAQAVNQHLESTKEDCWIQVLPDFHVGGRSIEARSFLSGARVVDGLLNEKWDARNFRSKIEDSKGTLSALVPTQVVDLIQAGLSCPSSMRAIVIGGSPLSLDVYKKGLDLGWPLLPSYGMTECCSQVATATLESLKTRKPELQLLSHISAKTNDEGLLRIQSPALFTGYAQWVQGKAKWVDPKEDGWYQTEDLVELNGKNLKPLGRGSDYVKISGEGVSLQKLQEILESLARQMEPANWQNVAVVAVPDARTQFHICLVFHLSIESSPSVEFLKRLKEEFNSKVAPFERIRSEQKVSAIPRTALGKIARGTLKELISEKVF